MRADTRTADRPAALQASCRPDSIRWPTCRTATCNAPRCKAFRDDREHDDLDEPTVRIAAAPVDAPAWSPGSNRARTPITAEDPQVPDDRPATRYHRPGPDEPDEWRPGRMRAAAKPSWGGRFASRMRGDSGMSTAEYALGTLAAVAFAGILMKVLTSGPVEAALQALIEQALS
ncbi:DUF4244 domain-containing protein [Glycomyces sp. NPDC047010]|uniref:DUF4244 domain-containing protein n=1 Tax=Glycomyces sp. NPDC047010 TaxID=3155023 RepID=UPI0033C2488F